ncbi:uncharacterized protein PgNI_01644 [Pyricularia grisea]|uniref:Uncharacterized protein n=1 Tax=Pyricularia grisea TaxID=148305 RepID=A0A6P8BJQ7_PYRGI|nr:uncharacterized protein PgNI_01644 [Pyricularia grisea]TLD16920.1 hypothetical protein PgNI_01644 [Pyricularia grisea]
MEAALELLPIGTVQPELNGFNEADIEPQWIIWDVCSSMNNNCRLPEDFVEIASILFQEQKRREEAFLKYVVTVNSRMTGYRGIEQASQTKACVC